MTGCTVKADCCLAVIDVLTAALPSPAIDTDTGMSSIGVETSAPIVAGIGLQLAFIHILSTELA